jgi:hypothetical protein
MRVCIAGSRKLPKGQGPRLLVRTLAALPGDTDILLRSSMAGIPGHFEQSVESLAHVLGLHVTHFMPIPTDMTKGRSSVYVRDISMVEAVLPSRPPPAPTDGYSGTAHLMEKALDVDRPMYAYTVADDGMVERVGEYDPDDAYSGVVPAV